MTKKMFLLFSHKLTPKQVLDAKSSLQVEEFVYLPEKLQTLWSNIPPHNIDIDAYLLPIKNFLVKNANKDDIVLIQGDFGAVYNMIAFSKQRGFIPVYSTTKRFVEEKVIDGKVEKSSVFEHVMFRRY